MWQDSDLLLLSVLPEPDSQKSYRTTQSSDIVSATAVREGNSETEFPRLRKKFNDSKSIFYTIFLENPFPPEEQHKNCSKQINYNFKWRI